MDVTALVMAGGKGTRLSLSGEKPLLRVGSKPLIEHVLMALKNAKKVNNIVVAVSNHTPKTANLMLNYPVSIIKTPGKGYISDMAYAIRTLGLHTVLAISADLPLIKADIIDDIVEFYERSGKSALSVAVSVDTKDRLGLGRMYEFEFNGKLLVPAGINLIDGQKIDREELEEEIYVLEKKEVAININTVKELKIAEAHFQKTEKAS